MVMMVRVTKTEGDTLNGKWCAIAIQCSVVMILDFSDPYIFYIL